MLVAADPQALLAADVHELGLRDRAEQLVEEDVLVVPLREDEARLALVPVDRGDDEPARRVAVAVDEVGLSERFGGSRTSKGTCRSASASVACSP